MSLLKRIAPDVGEPRCAVVPTVRSKKPVLVLAWSLTCEGVTEVTVAALPLMLPTIVEEKVLIPPIVWSPVVRTMVGKSMEATEAAAAVSEARAAAALAEAAEALEAALVALVEALEALVAAPEALVAALVALPAAADALVAALPACVEAVTALAADAVA